MTDGNGNGNEIKDKGDNKISVLLETEGTYPYVGGGVSTWCDILCRELHREGIEYRVYAITGDPNVTLKYELPANMKEKDVIHIPLWGTEEPAEYILPEVPFSEIYLHKQDTTEEAIEEHFIPLFRHLLKGINADFTDSAEALPYGTTLYEMYKYFKKYDYNTTFKSRQVWETFEEVILSPYNEDPERFKGEEQPSVYDLTVTMRWMYNLLMPLNAIVPKVDVTHSTIAGFASIASIVAKFEHGTPFILTEHGVFIRERYIGISQTELSFFQKRFLIRFSVLISQISYAYADQISPVANFNRRWEVIYGVPDDKLLTIYNGVNPAYFVPEETPFELGKPPTVVAIAHVFALKDIKTMIRAAAVTRCEIPDVQFRVYGSLDRDRPYVQECKELIEELGLDLNLHLVMRVSKIKGGLTPETCPDMLRSFKEDSGLMKTYEKEMQAYADEIKKEMVSRGAVEEEVDIGGNLELKGTTPNPAKRFNEADISILTSISEGFPYTVLESMSCGRPVVATDVGGVKEALQGFGMVCKPRDPQDVANGVIKLLRNHELRQSLGRKARNEVLAKYRTEISVNGYLDSYRRWVGKKIYPEGYSPPEPSDEGEDVDVDEGETLVAKAPDEDETLSGKTLVDATPTDES